MVACAYTPDKLKEVIPEFFEKSGYSRKRVTELKIEDWNTWRSENVETEIHLEGADLCFANLNNVNLSRSNLKGASFDGAHLVGGNFWRADLRGTRFYSATLNRAQFRKSNMQSAYFMEATLDGAKLESSILIDANFEHASLKGASFDAANLQRAKLGNAILLGADFSSAKLEGASAFLAVVNGNTQIKTGRVDINTDFTGVGLDNACISPATKAHLRYNIRRKGWESWYRANRFRKHTFRWPVWFFWMLSDYGRSTARIITSFFLFAIGFATVYTAWPQIIRSTGNLSDLDWGLRWIHSLYFSIVTMSTFGFAEMHANPDVLWSYPVVASQVLLGYIVLGAFITRFAIMFQGDAVPWTKHPTIWERIIHYDPSSV